MSNEVNGKKEELLTFLKDWYDYAREDKALNVLYPEERRAYDQIVVLIKNSERRGK